MIGTWPIFSFFFFFSFFFYLARHIDEHIYLPRERESTGGISYTHRVDMVGGGKIIINTTVGRSSITTLVHGLYNNSFFLPSI
jgi:hypothetical protein